MNREPLPPHPLLARLQDARRITDDLFSVVKPEFLYERPIAERHRIVFYIGHLEAFDRNLFDQRLFTMPVRQPEYDQLFAFGIDPVDGGLPTDQPSDWPSLEAIHAYIGQIRADIDERFDPIELTGAGAPSSTETLLEVAIEHRLMHAETLAYMLHQLPLDQKTGPKVTEEIADHPLDAHVSREMVRVPAGVAALGLVRDGGTFGWDNEFGRHQVEVPAFDMDRFMVTNADWLDFIDAGGYEHREYWRESDWAWKERERISKPAFWVRESSGESVSDAATTKGWKLRTMFDEIPLPADWPVYVSHAEASAYAKWAGKSLPTEAQWQRAAEAAPHAESGNFDFRRWEPSPVQAHPDNSSASGVVGQFGNGWEWTSTHFGPLPGFEPFPFYEGYSANFYDNQHYVLKGGSPRTAACMLRPSFRNWFQAHYQYVYAGFRCVRS